MSTQVALKKIRTFFKNQRRLPTYQELADMMGFASKNAAYKLANKLIEAGYLDKDETGKLVPKKLFAPLPNSGIIQAGSPSMVTEEINDLVSFDEYLVDRPESTFVLNVSGDSMIDAGIHEGDLVLVDRSQKAKDGDIVVANVDGEWTMKHFFKKGKDVFLVPANKNYKKIKPTESLEFAGVVTGVVRRIRH